MTGLTTYKRWSLRRGISVETVRRFVRDEIVPAYRRLSDAVELGLEVEVDRTRVLAVQRWRSVDARRAAMRGPAFDRWWDDYRAVLERWDELVEFVDEWETSELALDD